MVDIAIITLAVWHAGGAITPLNPASTSGEIGRQLKDSRANFVVSHSTCLSVVLSAAVEANIRFHATLLCGEAPSSRLTTATQPIHHWRAILSPAPPPILPPAPIPNPKTTTALIPYSSGTSGLPKGVILTHYNIVSNVLQTQSNLTAHVSWTGGTAHTTKGIPSAPIYNHSTGLGGDVTLAVLPLYHIYGLMGHILRPLYDGTKCVIDDTCLRWDPVRYADNVHHFGVTIGYIVPPMALGLLKASTSAQGHKIKDKISGLRMLISAAAPMGKDTIERLWSQLGLRTVQAFGMSEASPALLQLDWNEWWSGRGSVGKPLAGVEAKIIKISATNTNDWHDKEKADQEEANAGEEGELVVRGPNLFSGYLIHDAASDITVAIDVNGWFRTGDIGVQSPSTGVYHITDRVKELIKYKGFSIAPAELESVLLTYTELVEDVFVLGIWDVDAGTEVPRAYAVRKGGVSSVQPGDEERIVKFVEGKVAGYKRLRGGVRFVESVPKSAAGKMLRRVLKENVTREDNERRWETSQREHTRL